MEKNRIKAVIYDMDGVIIDSEPLWKIAQIETFASVGFDFTRKECEQTVGLRIDEVIDFWFDKEPWAGKSKPEMVKEIMQRMITLIFEKGKALDGVVESLSYFKTNGYKIGLATSSYTSLLNAVLKQLEIADFFDYTLSAQHCSYGKPHPEVYLQTAKQLNVNPINCLVIEDSFNGMLAGMAAKMKVAVIPEKSHTINPKLKLADLYFNNLNELTKHFKLNKN